MGSEFLCEKVKGFWGWMVVMVAQQCECAQCRPNIRFKMVKLVNLCYVYVTKVFIKKNSIYKNKLQGLVHCFEGWEGDGDRGGDSSQCRKHSSNKQAC